MADGLPASANLRGEAFLQWLFPPITRINESSPEEDSKYALMLLLGFEEYGTMIQKATLTLFDSDDVEIQSGPKWTTVQPVNGEPIKHFTEVQWISHGRPIPIPTIYIKGTEGEGYPLEYEIQAIAMDANEVGVPLDPIGGKFVVELYE